MKIKILLIIFGVFLLCGISFAEIPGSVGPYQMPEGSAGDTETYRPHLEGVVQQEAGRYIYYILDTFTGELIVIGADEDGAVRVNEVVNIDTIEDKEVEE